jgi:hypothetical protein
VFRHRANPSSTGTLRTPSSPRTDRGARRLTTRRHFGYSRGSPLRPRMPDSQPGGMGGGRYPRHDRLSRLPRRPRRPSLLAQLSTPSST